MAASTTFWCLLLEHSRNAQEVRLPIIVELNFFTTEFYAPPIRTHNSRDDIKKRRFSCSVLADNTDDAIACDGKANIVENQRFTKAFRQSVDF